MVRHPCKNGKRYLENIIKSETLTTNKYMKTAQIH